MMGVLLLQGPPGDVRADEWRRVIRWQGQNNAIGPCAHGVITTWDREWKAVCPTLQSFLGTWAPGLKGTRYKSVVCPYKKGQVAWDAWRLSHFERVHRSLPRGVRDVGADLAYIPDPPEVDASGQVIRPATVPAKTREGEKRPQASGARPQPDEGEIIAVDPAKGPIRTLREAFDKAKTVTGPVVIELRGNGPFRERGLVAKKPFTLRAGDGYAPTVEFDPGGGKGNLLHLQSPCTRAAIEGIRFVMHGNPDYLLLVDAAHFRMTRCTVVQGAGAVPRPVAWLLANYRQVEIRDSLLYGCLDLVSIPVTMGIENRIDLTNNVAVGVRHLLLVCGQAPATARDAAIELHLTRNTVAAAEAILLFGESMAGFVPPGRVAVELDGNVLMPMERRSATLVRAVPASGQPLPSADAWLRNTEWRGGKSLVGGFRSMVAVGHWLKDDDRAVCRTSREFMAKWGKGLADMRFAKGAWESAAPADLPPHEWTLDRVKAAYKKLPGFMGAKYGADLERLEKPTKTPEAGSGTGRGTGTEAEPPQVKTLVVDPDNGPYKTLKDAVDDVKPDDDVVIELRTNGVLEATGLQVECHRLSVRAGRGFSPILQSPGNANKAGLILVKQGEEATFQGLHFVGPVTSGNALCLCARRVRIERCTFRDLGSTLAYAVSLTGNVKEATVTDCLFLGFKVCLIVQDGKTIHFTNNVVLSGGYEPFWIRPPYEGQSRAPLEMHMARNTVVTPQIVFGLNHVCDRAPPSLVTVHLDDDVILPTTHRHSALFWVAVVDDKEKRGPDAVAAAREVRLSCRGTGGLVGGFQSFLTAQQSRQVGYYEKSLCTSSSQFLATWGRGLKKVRFTNQLWPDVGSQTLAPHQWDLARLRAAYSKLGRPVGTKWGADLSRLPEPPKLPTGH